LGIGPNPQSPIPNPQSPIPNPQSPVSIKNNLKKNEIKFIILNDKNKLLLILYIKIK
jgi:hypothetical protein